MNKAEFIKLLKSGTTHKLAESCVFALEQLEHATRFELHLFDRERQLEVLTKRLSSPGAKNIDGYKLLIDQLKGSKESAIRIFMVAIADGTYFIYLDEKMKSIIGITYNKNVNMKKYLALDQEYIERGLQDRLLWEKNC